MLPETCLHSQVRSCWLQAEVTKAAAVGHQESMLGEESFMLRGFQTPSVTFPAWPPFNTLVYVKVGKSPVAPPLGLLRVNPGWCGYLALLEQGWKELLNQVWENLAWSRSVQCQRTTWCYYLMLIISFPVEQSVYLSAYWYSFAISSLGWKWEGMCYSSAWCSTAWEAPAHNSKVRAGYQQ